MSLLSFLHRFVSPAARRRHCVTRRLGRLLALEHLETREVLSTTIGMNIERVTDYSADWMFTDAFKASRPWIPQLYNTTTHAVTLDTTGQVPISLDSKGWPTQLGQTVNAQGQTLVQILGTAMYDNLSGHYPGGIYTAWWDGTGTLRWGGDVTVTQTGMTPDGHHFAPLNDTPGSQGIRLQLLADSPADHVRNIHVWMPDYNGQSFVGQVWHPGASFSPFHPLFLQRLAPFGTLRFMQDSETITSQVQHWSDRRPWDYATQMSGMGFQNGIAPEYIIEMCNELKAYAWINIPHMADDNYVRNLATLVRDTLNPGLKIDLEWSNEVWNGATGFIPHQWVMQQLALPQNAGLSFVQFVALQERRVFGDWESVFTGQTNRVVRVAAGFEANPNYTAQLLQNMNGDFDAVSCAAYFGPNASTRAGYSLSTTMDQILSDTSASIPQALAFLTAHRHLADQYSAALGRPIQFLAYEGGPALEGHHQSYQAAMNAASVDPRMYGIYRTFRQGANKVELNVLVNYEYTDRNMPNSPYGIYGALNYQDEPIASAPKYHALLDAANGSLYGSGSSMASVPSSAVAPSPGAAAPAAQAGAPAAEPNSSSPLPVLLVIGNQNFYYKEYHDTLVSLQQAGLQVVVAAGTHTLCYPIANTGQGSTSGTVMPDLAITDAVAANYSAIVFVGGGGASEYQYAFTGAYVNPALNGTPAIRAATNQLIDDFVSQGKYVAGLCHGVTVLAWARVNGVSLLQGHTVTTYEGSSPAYMLNGVMHSNDPDRLMSMENGATVLAPRSIGNPYTTADDVWTDGKIITGENYDSATLFGQVVAQRVLNG
jgi:putative intracellular protease/amidase